MLVRLTQKNKGVKQIVLNRKEHNFEQSVVSIYILKNVLMPKKTARNHVVLPLKYPTRVEKPSLLLI